MINRVPPHLRPPKPKSRRWVPYIMALAVVGGWTAPDGCLWAECALAAEERVKAALVVLRLGGTPDLPLMETLRALAVVMGELVDQNPGLLLAVRHPAAGAVIIDYKMDGCVVSNRDTRRKAVP